MPAEVSLEPRVAAEPRAEGTDEKKQYVVAAHGENETSARMDGDQDGTSGSARFPTPEELATLRRVPNHIPLKLFTIAFVELCERFSYYGCMVVCESSLSSQ